MRTVRILGLVVLTAVLASACSRVAPTEEVVRSVKVMTVGAVQPEVTSEFAAEVRARNEVRLGLRVAGKLVQRSAEVGQRVRAGDVLARVDPQDYRLAAQAAAAQVVAAQTNRDQAQADYRRSRELREQNFISSAELERRQTAVQAAQAQLDQALAQAQAQSNQAQYAQLVADAPGVVVGVEAEVGQVLAAGTPVVRLALDGPRDVVFAVPEDRVGEFSMGQSVQLKPWAGGPGRAARVREVAAAADPVTRTFLVRAALADGGALPLGTTLTVVTRQSSQALPSVQAVPSTALRQDGPSTAVWVLDAASMTVQLKPVQVAGVDGNQVLLAQGLEAGTRIVVAGVHALAPGQKVALYRESAKAQAAAAR